MAVEAVAVFGQVLQVPVEPAAEVPEVLVRRDQVVQLILVVVVVVVLLMLVKAPAEQAAVV
jgi:hypothetical protein